MHARYDVLIAGAGFAGSLAALILQRLGLRVCLVEKARHPRFAIGESSTPAADMILRDLAREYDLPWLQALSRYGTWCRQFPDVMRGLKRGFSFYKHHPGKAFYTDAQHSHELLVAASADDEHSDTQWLRADFDAFLVSKVQEAGIDYWDETEIGYMADDGVLSFALQRGEGVMVYRPIFLSMPQEARICCSGSFRCRAQPIIFIRTLLPCFLILSRYRSGRIWLNTWDTIQGIIPIVLIFRRCIISSMRAGCGCCVLMMAA